LSIDEYVFIHGTRLLSKNHISEINQKNNKASPLLDSPLKDALKKSSYVKIILARRETHISEHLKDFIGLSSQRMRHTVIVRITSVIEIATKERTSDCFVTTRIYSQNK
jgi:hypothetical protein